MFQRTLDNVNYFVEKRIIFFLFNYYFVSLILFLKEKSFERKLTVK